MSNNPCVNLEQKEFWNEIKGPLWLKLQPKIDTLLEPFDEKAIGILNPMPGEKILEIGCGTGTSTINLSKKVTSSGEILAVDLSRTLLDKAISRLSTMPKNHTKFVEADAQVYKFPVAEFDAAYSRFGVMFFDDPLTAFYNIFNAIKAGGRLTYVCWADRMKNKWIRIPVGAAKEFLEIPPPPLAGAPGQFSMEDEDCIRKHLIVTGWKKIRLERFEIEHSIGKDVDDASKFIAQMGPMSELFTKTSQSIQKKTMKAMRTALKPFENENGVQLGFSTWIVSAVHP